MKASEQKIYGKNACLAFAKLSPEKVIRAYCTEESRGRLGQLLKFLASQKRAYHIVTTEDLSKVCESEHHEGICLLVERTTPRSDEQLLSDLKRSSSRTSRCVLCLDGIANPHNLGAIARTAAHFGVKQILLCGVSSEAQKVLLSAAFHRTAEGGAPHVDIYAAPDGSAVLSKLKRELGWKILVTSSHGQSKPLNRIKFPEKCVVVMGSEAHGVSAELIAVADERICIDGTGHVESLNVACATAIFLNEQKRQSESQREPVSRAGSIPTRAVRAAGKKRMGS